MKSEDNILRDAEKERIFKKEKKVKEAKHIPTLEESWTDILSNKKLTNADRTKLEAVKEYMDRGIIGREQPKEGRKQGKFSKAEALRLYLQVKELRREEILNELVEKTPENYILVTTPEEASEMWEDCKEIIECGYDTETTGLDKYKDKIVGHCLYNPVSDKSYYVPFRHVTNEIQLDFSTVDKLFKHLLAKILKKICHNAQYDMHMCINDGLPITGEWHCTQTIAHMFNENEMSFALKNLVPKYLGIPSDKYGDLFGDGGFEGVPLKYARYYGANDPKITYMLYKWYEDFGINDKYGMGCIWKEYLEVEMPLIKVVVEMERVGFIINEKHMGQQSEEYGKEIYDLECELKNLLGDINFGSPAQLLPALKKATGENIKGTGKKILKPLKSQYRVVALLLEWRAKSKLKNDFMDKLPNFKKESTGRFHSSAKPRGTVTGRFASVEFNAQQIHKIIRQSFEAPEGQLIVSADFGGQENRWLGHFCQDEKMIEGWANGVDFYSRIGSDVFQKPYEECGDGTQWRNLSKVIVLAVTYGISPIELGASILPAIMEDRGFTSISDKLISELKITVKKKNGNYVDKDVWTSLGNKIIRDFLDAFPRIEPWMKATRKLASEKGYVLMEFGNKRRLPLPKEVYMEESKATIEVDKMRQAGYDLEERRKGKDILIPWKFLPEWKRKSIKGGIDRQAVNSVIQGTSAEQTKRVMIEADKWCKHKRSHGREFYLLFPVHDELLFYAPEDITKEEIDVIEMLMTQTVTLQGIDVVTDIAVGKNWKDMEPQEEFFKSQKEWIQLWNQRNWMSK
ncbi:DNA polymerase [Bacillus phage vB_BthS_BMBphi]|nr:DNA polymerase [Bacillus phage vB_BthS_BMBphi]